MQRGTLCNFDGITSPSLRPADAGGDLVTPLPEGPPRRTDFHQDLFERSADAHLIIDRGAFVDCNQATVEMLRYRNKEEFLRVHPSALSPKQQPDGRDSREKADEMMALAFEKGSHRFEWDHVRADGEVFPVEVLLTAVPRNDRTLIHVVWRDITARKQLEEHLRHAQKMEAVGRMAGGIAHDFNNLLLVVIGNSDLLASRLQDQPKLVAYVDEIHGAANRAATLVRQLMAFSRRQDVQLRVLDLAEALRDMDGLLHRLLDERYRLDVRVSEGAIRIQTGPGQLEQLIINLLTNARDAMPAGGPITVEVRRFDYSGGSIGVGIELPHGRYALLSVSDSGHGMPPEVVRRAFEPFFTTKEVGRGTGLGLATVYAIARHCGGGAEIQSAEGHGTTVCVYLPLTDEEVATSDHPPYQVHVEHGTESILVVEDEPAVAALVVRVLRTSGYRVLVASDGLHALGVWGVRPHPVDLVLSDVVMPRLGGVDMVRRLRSLGYQGHVLLMSGYANEALTDTTDIGDDVELLEKPFAAAELLEKVRSVLARRSSRHE
ncbi:MAG: hypothetical protein C0497_08680 [Gemmatimonas sp.]|nr:hypothetical protein [Gemmatimonas sp.]